MKRWDSSAVGLHHVARHPERTDETQGKNVGANGWERPDGDRNLSEGDDAPQNSQHGPRPVAFQVEVLKGRLSLGEAPNEACEGGQCDEREHAVHHGALEIPHAKASDKAGKKHPLDGRDVKAHGSAEVKGILEISQRDACSLHLHGDWC